VPEGVIARAVADHRPIRRFCLFSGGNDSGVVAHRCRDGYDTLLFLDTGTALPGVVAHVQETAAWLGKPLEIVRHEGDQFRALVLGLGQDRSRPGWHPLGFPGPAQHARAYNVLKQRLIERVLRETKEGHPRSARVAFLTGVRRAESARRRGRVPVNRKGSAVFVNPLIDWSNAEMRDYRLAHGLPESDVAALVHRSGECNCGSFAAPGEAAMLRSLWPDWFEDRIGNLEREAEAAGIKYCTWGGRPPGDPGDAEPVGPLCASCENQLALEGMASAA